MSFSVPSKDSALGRAIRVLGYQVGVILLAFLADPTTVKALGEYYPQLATLLVVGAPFISFIYNVVRKDVDNF